jgi:hypothetical protein
MTGTFGRVLECWDREEQEYVAVKIIRNVKKYHQAAMIEVRTRTRTDEHNDATHTRARVTHEMYARRRRTPKAMRIVRAHV